MSDSVKGSRLMQVGALHGAVVTRVDFDELDGVVLDAALAEAAGFLEHEKVEVQSDVSGARLACQLRFAPAGSREVAMTGAAAHHLKPGDRLSLAAFAWVKQKAAHKHRPRVVRVAADNTPLDARAAHDADE